LSATCSPWCRSLPASCEVIGDVPGSVKSMRVGKHEEIQRAGLELALVYRPVRAQQTARGCCSRRLAGSSTTR
jgi:hypothetical protein